MSAITTLNRPNTTSVAVLSGSGTAARRMPSGFARSLPHVPTGPRRVACSGVAIVEGDVLRNAGSDILLRSTVRVRRKKEWNWSGVCGQPEPAGLLPTGDVLIIVVPNQSQSGSKVLSVVVSAEQASRALVLHGLKLTSCVDRELAEPERSAIVATIAEMWSRSGTGSALDRLHLDGLFHRLVALLHPGNLDDAGCSERADARLVRALQYVEAHLGEQLSVLKLANVAGMSEAHFSKSFRAAMSEPVWSYVQRRRAEHAFDLLARTDLGLAEIAFACGYASQAHMTTCVKDRYGETPGVIRKRQIVQR